MTDLRPAFASAQAAFGLTASVTLPSASAVSATVVWIPPVSVEYPQGEYRRAEALRVLAVGVDEVPVVPRGTVINVAPYEGGDAADWLVDQSARVDSDHHRVVVVPSA